MSQSLSSCPYCFGLTPAVSPCVIGFRVFCRQCLATGPHKPSREEAVRAWNRQSVKMHQAREANHSRLSTRLKELEQTVFTHR